MDYVAAIAVDLIGYGIGLVVGTIFHEFGHAAAGWLLGFAPRLINIGRGKIIVRRRIGDAWLVVRALPIGGAVWSLPRSRDRRWASAGTTAAGPAVNLALGSALAPILWRQLAGDDIYLVMFLLGFTVAQLFLGAVALVPFRFRVGRDRRLRATDGLKLLWFFRGREPDQLALLRATYLRHPHEPDTPLPAVTPDTPEVLYQLSRWDFATEQWARRDSIAVLRRILAGARLAPAEITVVRTRLAIADAHPDLF